MAYTLRIVLLALCLLSFLFTPSLSYADDFYWYGEGDSKNTIFPSSIDPITGQRSRSLFPTPSSIYNYLYIGGDFSGIVFGGVDADTINHENIEVEDFPYGFDVKLSAGSTVIENKNASNNTVEVENSHIDYELLVPNFSYDEGSLFPVSNFLYYGGSIFGGAACIMGSVTTSATIDVDFGAYGAAVDLISLATTASDNVVSINNSQVDNLVFGGLASTHITEKTSTNVKTDSVEELGDVTAVSKAISNITATASNNEVKINNSKVGNVVVGGLANSRYDGSLTAISSVATPSLSTSSVTLSTNVVSEASGNLVVVFDNSKALGITGGAAHSNIEALVSTTATSTDASMASIEKKIEAHSKAIASGNRVLLENSSAHEVNGGYATAEVYIEEGYDNAETDYDEAGILSTAHAEASTNVVTIVDSRVSNIAGGIAVVSGNTPNLTSVASKNTVYLFNNVAFNAESTLYGGFAEESYDNVLFAANYTGTTSVGTIDYFQDYYFALPETVKAGDAYISAEQLNLTGVNYSSDTNVRAIALSENMAPLHAGDTLYLIKANTEGTLTNAGSPFSLSKGIALLYDTTLYQDTSGIYLEVDKASANPRLKSLSEGRAAGLAFVGQGADLIMGAGMRAAMDSGEGLTAFTAGQGGTSRYDTGSHVDVDGFSFLAGLAWNANTAYGSLMLGAFFESGWGSYDAHNSFTNFASVKGDGDLQYTGGGVLGRFDFVDCGPGHIYTEASFRTGYADTDYSTSDILKTDGRDASYDTGANYYGAHAGLGYIWNITERSSLDLYTKYIWTHIGSDSASVDGNPIHFDSADSHRWRTGGSYSIDLTTNSGRVFTPYVGAAYEYEFDGENKASVYGYSISAPDLSGSTGIGELGVSFKPTVSSGFSMDLAVQGYTGQREGVTGSLQLSYTF